MRIFSILLGDAFESVGIEPRGELFERDVM